MLKIETYEQCQGLPPLYYKIPIAYILQVSRLSYRNFHSCFIHSLFPNLIASLTGTLLLVFNFMNLRETSFLGPHVNNQSFWLGILLLMNVQSNETRLVFGNIVVIVDTKNLQY